MNQLSIGVLAIALFNPSGNGASAKISGQRELSATPTNKPTVICVADFDLDAADIKAEKGLVPPPPKLPGPLGDALSVGAARDPQKLARELVDTMREALVKQLMKAGFTAGRYRPGEPLPTSGWLVRGVFTEVNQGNQLRRTVIGFGAGKTDLQVLVDIADLSAGQPKDFYELDAAANSGKLPGAGPMIVLCPAGAAVRHVIAGKDLHRNTKQTAKHIAEEIVQRTQPNRKMLPVGQE